MVRILGVVACLAGAMVLAWLATIAPPSYYGVFIILASLLGIVTSLVWNAARRP